MGQEDGGRVVPEEVVGEVTDISDDGKREGVSSIVLLSQ